MIIGGVLNDLSGFLPTKDVGNVKRLNLCFTKQNVMWHQDLSINGINIRVARIINELKLDNMHQQHSPSLTFGKALDSNFDFHQFQCRDL
jgi:hypothetical protein